MIRLLIVEDSVTQREIFKRLLAADGEFTVVAEAANGRDGAQLVRQHRPDVVLMDIHMPDGDGIEATREIMRESPVPIVIASASLQRHDVDLAMEALQAGAVSVIEKPAGAVLLHLHKMAAPLCESLRAATAARVRRTAPRAAQGLPATSARSGIRSKAAAIKVIALCASTGGPPVLLEILSAIPRPFPLPILLVQHISRGFEEGFARWLGGASGQQVELAQDGQRLTPGVWMGSGGRHLTVNPAHRVVLSPGGADEFHCPSGNAMFSSLAAHLGNAALGVLLTGMGDDGANGLLALRQAGGMTVVQDEASSMIWGMPKVAKERGAAALELSPAEIAATLQRLATSAGS